MEPRQNVTGGVRLDSVAARILRPDRSFRVHARENAGGVPIGSDAESMDGGGNRHRHPVYDRRRHAAEGGPQSTGDRHVLVVDRDACRDYELYAASPTGTGWDAGSGAIFDLNSNAMRPSHLDERRLGRPDCGADGCVAPAEVER